MNSAEMNLTQRRGGTKNERRKENVAAEILKPFHQLVNSLSQIAFVALRLRVR
jgi:hypothetical protein